MVVLFPCQQRSGAVTQHHKFVGFLVLFPTIKAKVRSVAFSQITYTQTPLLLLVTTITLTKRCCIQN